MSKTDVDIVRELLQRATDDLHAPSAVTADIVARHRRRLRNTRVLSVATTSLAAAAVAAAVVLTRVGAVAPGQAQHPAALPATQLPAVKLPPVKLDAVQVLDKLSVAAGRAPQPVGRYVALTESRMGFGNASERMTVIDGLTGDIWTYQHGQDVPSELPVYTHWSPTRAEFGAWPTDPAKLRDLLVQQGKQATGAGTEESAQLPARQTPDDIVFQEATNWLWNPLPGPALRAALYQVLAATSGVTVQTGVTDKAGRPAIEISRDDSATGERQTTFESPSTGAVLEQSWSDAGTAVYTAATGYATLPPDPYSGG